MLNSARVLANLCSESHVGEDSCDRGGTHSQVGSPWEGDIELNGSLWVSIIDLDLLDLPLDCDHIVNVCVRSDNSKVVSVRENDTSNICGGINLDVAALSLFKLPRIIFISLELVRATIKWWALNQVRLTITEWKILTTFPSVYARSRDIVPGILKANLSGVTVRVRKHNSRLTVHPLTV